MKLKATDEAADLVGPFHVHLLKGCPNVLVHLFFLFLFLILYPKVLGSSESLWQEGQNFVNSYERLQDRKLSQPTQGSDWSYS